jgi:hypothetical protein
MERNRHSNIPMIALLIALIDVVVIFYTVQKELPSLQIELQSPFPQVLYQPKMWFNLAEILFHSGGLIIIYGVISLLVPSLRFTLHLGMGLANLAGVSYLFSLVMSYRARLNGASITQAIFMFLLCMILPFLVSKLYGLIKGPNPHKI